MSKYFKYLLTSLPILLASCSDEPEIEDPGVYENGVFITNEGNFGEGDGSLSFYSTSTSIISNNVFSSANSGSQLGDVVQSAHIDGDRLFVVVNNSNKVEVADLQDQLKRLYTIDGVSLPRHMTTHDGKGYLTEWVSFSEPGRVTIFDLEDGSINQSIITDFGAENVLIAGSKLFVSNNFSTTVSVIDLESNEILETLQAGNGPAGMVADSDGDVWLLCSGGYDQDYNPLNDGKLVEIDPSTLSIKNELELGRNVSGKVAKSPQGTSIYYFLGKQVFTVGTTDTQVSAEPFIEEEGAIGFYGIGVDADGILYLSDARGFAENGDIYRYSSSGVFLDRFTAGRGPNGFVFN